jgi:hypothetical protein
MPVHVDFDPIECRLLFSKEPEESPVYDEDRGDRMMRQQQHKDQTIERLASQAIPAMTRFLKEYRVRLKDPIESFLQDPAKSLGKLSIRALKGELKLLGGSANECLEKSDLVQQLIDGKGNSESLASFLVSVNLESPPCVCGNTLERVDSKTRCLQFLQSNVRPEYVEMTLQQKINKGSTSMVCDICDENIPFQTFVWTCRNETCTILHATAYDVCDTCFIRHACRVTPDISK